MSDIVKERFAKIRNLTKKSNVFKWQNVCQSLNSTHNIAEIQKFARIFGVPPAYWDNPRKVCSLITPRVTDYLEKIHCDNADEPTMEGDPVGEIPEYLKYTFKASNGMTYCYSIVDLYNALQHGQRQDPYRRFTLDSSSISERYKFLKSIIEPQGLASTIMDNIRNMALVLSPDAVIRNKLGSIWDILRYPKYTIDEMINASEEVLNGLWESISSSEGLDTQITNQERNMFLDAPDKNTKLNMLVDTMHRILHNDELGVVPVALELAINNSVEMPNVIPNESRRRRRSSASSEGRNVRQRTSEDDSSEDEFADMNDDTYEAEPEHPEYNLRDHQNVNTISERGLARIKSNLRTGYYGFTYKPREHKILFMDDFDVNGDYYIPKSEFGRRNPDIFYRREGDEVFIYVDGEEIPINEMNT